MFAATADWCDSGVASGQLNWQEFQDHQDLASGSFLLVCSQNGIIILESLLFSHSFIFLESSASSVSSFGGSCTSETFEGCFSFISISIQRPHGDLASSCETCSFRRAQESFRSKAWWWYSYLRSFPGLAGWMPYGLSCSFWLWQPHNSEPDSSYMISAVVDSCLSIWSRCRKILSNKSEVVFALLRWAVVVRSQSLNFSFFFFILSSSLSMVKKGPKICHKVLGFRSLCW